MKILACSQVSDRCSLGYLFHELLYEKTKTSLTQFSRFAHEIICSNVMSGQKALIIGHERPEDTKGLVNSLAHLNTASLFVITKQRSQYISRLENVGMGQYKNLLRIIFVNYILRVDTALLSATQAV